MFDLALGTSMFAGAILVVCLLAALGHRGLGGFLLENEMATSFFVIAAVASASLGMTFAWTGMSILSLTVIMKAGLMLAAIIAAIIFCVIFFKISNRKINAKRIAAQ